MNVVKFSDRNQLSVRNKPLLTIGIINRNTVNLLADLLTSISNQKIPVCYEIIVVDNASGDGSTEMVKNFFPDVTLIYNQQNLGFTIPCNQIMKAMNGDYLFLLNTDLILYPKIIEQLLAYLESDDQIAVCGPRLYNRDMTVQLSAQKYHTFFSVFWEIIGIAKRMPTSRIFGYAPYFKNEIKHPTEVEYISGAFMAISKRAINKVGLFDENFFLYTQEVDFCLRCKMHGLKVYYYPDVSAIHLQGETSKQLSFKSDYWLWKDRLFYFQKYYGKFYAISCKFMIRAIMFIKYSITKVQMLGKSKQISNKQKNYEYIFRNL